MHLKVRDENCLCHECLHISCGKQAVQVHEQVLEWVLKNRSFKQAASPLSPWGPSSWFLWKYFLLKKLCNAPIPIFFLLVCPHRSACGQLWAGAILLLRLLVLHILFQSEKCPLVCRGYEHSCWSLIFTSSRLPPCSFTLTLYRVLWWRTEQSLVTLYSQYTFIALLLVCCGCKGTPSLLSFTVVSFLQLDKEDKRETRPLWSTCSCGVTWTAQPAVALWLEILLVLPLGPITCPGPFCWQSLFFTLSYH